MSKPSGGNAVAPSPATGHAAAYGALILIAFLSSFVAACVFLDGQLSFPSVPGIGPRFVYFAHHKDNFDSLFIGSSRIRHQVIPPQFDAETATQGTPTHSFNLGYSGMWPPESYYFLRRVLALHPKRLRWVFIELMDYRFGSADAEPATERAIYWHDAKHTGMAWRLVAETSLPAFEKVALIARHASQLVHNMSNAGRGAEWLEQRYLRPKRKTDMSWIGRSGFDPEPEGVWTGKARVEYERKISFFEQNRTKAIVRPGFAAALRDLIDDVRRAGAEPILVVPPTVLPEEHFSNALLPRVTVLAFDDPSEFPRLYMPELHYDAGHLSPAGAKEFTSELAQQFLRTVRAR